MPRENTPENETAGGFCKHRSGSTLTPLTIYPTHEVSKNGRFEPFIYKNDHFAKTGSGQT
jgi:hypothetical protein